MSHFYTTALRVKDLDFKPPFSAAYRTEFVKRWNVQWASVYLDYLELNLTSYLGRQVYINLIYRPLFSHRVNDEEVKMVHDFWEAHTAYTNDKSVDIQDSITAYPPHKNLIFIIVESLNSFVVNQKIDGREVTPTLNALIREPGTVSALNVETQILTGASSDGQFIYNTGMLPSSEVTTVYYYDKNQYASLAHTFKDRYSFEMICESAAVWNHANTTIAYGYDQLYSDIEREKTHRGRDGNLFDHASMVIDTLRVPFFAELTTISMHGPFKDPDVSRPDWIDKAKMTESMRDYLTVTHYFDEELGKFLAHLKQRGIYEDTMIVIASDHNVLVEGMAEEQNRRRIVFVAANTGVTAQIGKVVGQVDVFPTVLELMGVDADTTWSGVGLSMFNPHCQGALDKEGRVVGASSDSAYVEHLKLARKASNVMLRMDYFKR
jgi:phosphoglycerol transferase MdoB-like AlkP superfamily enzyme